MRLVVGLGNPGDRYRRTRHNIGFMVVDALAARAGTRLRESADALVAPARFGDTEVLLVKPLTFMNRSGVATLRLLLAHAAAPPDLLVIVDDIALELGAIRLRERGSHGGHNGLRSLIEVLGSEDFPRLRLGINRTGFQGDLAEYVLAEFAPEDVLVVQEVVGAAADAVECCLREGAAVAMNRYNGTRLTGG